MDDLVDTLSLSTAPCSDSVCARCKELGIHGILDQAGTTDKDGKLKLWLKTMSHVEVGVLTQRCLFDVGSPLSQDCSTCSKLQDAMSERFTVFADPDGDTSTHGGTSFAADDSWFEMQRSGFEHRSWKAPEQFYTQIIGRGAPSGYYIGDIFGISLPALANTEHPLHGLYVRKVPAKIVDYTVLKGWLNSCCQTHPLCDPDRPGDLRYVRLIDVRNRTLVPIPVEETVTYAALSYVWGSIQSRNYKLGTLGELPHTIEDAISVTRRIDVPYLWTDYVCIDQADDKHKAQQIGMMDVIYGKAFVTIISLNGTSANEGLPRVGDTTKYVPQAIISMGKGNSLLSKMPLLSAQLESSSWGSRAWTFQETLLSTRRLIFSRHQIYYACNEMVGSETNVECVPANYQLSSETLNLFANPFISSSCLGSVKNGTVLYKSLAAEFAKRELTRSSDALNAFLGLLQRLQDIEFHDGFVFGLPRTAFRFHLLWYQNPRNFGYTKYNEQDLERREEFPSWTWLGWKWIPDLDWLHRTREGGWNGECSWCQSKQPPLEYSGNICEATGPCRSTTHMNFNVPRSVDSELDRAIHDLPQSLSTNLNYDTALPPGVLVITGVVLRIPIVLQECKGSRYDFDEGFRTVPFTFDKVTLKKGISQQLSKPRFNHYLDGPIRRLLQDNMEKEVDFLVLALQHVRGGAGVSAPSCIRLHMLMLEWKDNIAYRVAVSTLTIDGSRIRELFTISKARRSRLNLG